MGMLMTVVAIFEGVDMALLLPLLKSVGISSNSNPGLIRSSPRTI